MVKDEPQLSGWQSGFFTNGGTMKPGFYSFQLPIVIKGRRGMRTTVYGQVRPGHARRTYRLQRLAHGHWVSIGHLARTNVFGTYTRAVRVAKGTRLRILYYPRPVKPDNTISSRPIIAR
jgi:hypothetical protein